MKVKIDNELMELLVKIGVENKTVEEWSEIESSDMFQSKSYCGGFDADEQAFCFSYYGGVSELWFQFDLDELDRALSGVVKEFAAVEAY